MKRFEEIPHTADWSFRAFGRDLPELFENAAFGLFSLEGAVPIESGNEETALTFTVSVAGIDLESLLVNWLSELLYLQESKRVTLARFHVQELAPTGLSGLAFGAPGIRIDKLIKAVTYHNLRISQTADGWEAVVVVDV